MGATLFICNITASLIVLPLTIMLLFSNLVLYIEPATNPKFSILLLFRLTALAPIIILSVEFLIVELETEPNKNPLLIAWYTSDEFNVGTLLCKKLTVIEQLSNVTFSTVLARIP